MLQLTTPHPQMSQLTTPCPQMSQLTTPRPQMSQLTTPRPQMSQDNKVNWQSQLQNMQAAQAAHHYNSYHYSDIYNSPGSSSHSGKDNHIIKFTNRTVSHYFSLVD